jgi:predicted HD phosphohydrolase
LAEQSNEDFQRSVQDFSKVASSKQQIDRVVGLLKAQKGTHIGAQVDLYEHGLQTATRAYRDGADEETIVCALLHDIGELITPICHGEIAASVLRPYISPSKRYYIIPSYEPGYYVLKRFLSLYSWL